MKRYLAKVISVTVLVSYLGIFVANAVHYHNFNFIINVSNQINSGQTQKSFIHSLDNCIVNQVFNSINTSYHNSTNSLNTIPDIISFLSFEFLTRPQNHHLSNLNSRAPPFSHS